MIRATLLLAFWQLRNALRTALTDPKKLIPLLFVAFFVGLQVLGQALATSAPPPPMAANVITAHPDLIFGVAFLVLVLIALAILDYGFSGGFLSFPMADVDYLFPSPVPRRLVLIYRLLAKTVLAFFQGSFLFYFLLWRLTVSFAPAEARASAALSSLSALFCCIGGWANLAFSLKLIFEFGKAAVVRRWIVAAVLGVVGVAVYLFSRHGVYSLTQVSQSEFLNLVFYPCRLTALQVTAPLTGHGSHGNLLPLATFYLVTLALLLSRNENFYEASLEGSERAARLLQAAREQNWAAIFAIRSERKKKRPVDDRRGAVYALAPFGRGGGALLWANFCAAAKRPWMTFWTPLLSGIVLVGVGQFWIPPAGLAYVVGAVASYLLFVLTLSTSNAFRVNLQRGVLVRPLPFQSWQVVLADVAPRLFVQLLFAWSAGFALLVSRAPHASMVAVLLIVALPPAVGCLNFVHYIVALWFPEAQDKLQQTLGVLVSLLATGFFVGPLVALVAVLLLLKVALWVLAISLFLPLVLCGAVLLAVCAYVYGRFEPKSG